MRIAVPHYGLIIFYLYRNFNITYVIFYHMFVYRCYQLFYSRCLLNQIIAYVRRTSIKSTERVLARKNPVNATERIRIFTINSLDSSFIFCTCTTFRSIYRGQIHLRQLLVLWSNPLSHEIKCNFNINSYFCLSLFFVHILSI